MAITKSISLRGITIPGAYIRIDRIMGGKYSGFQAESGVVVAQGKRAILLADGTNVVRVTADA